jgi:hypothetical protein
MDITTILPPVYLLCKQPKNKTKPTKETPKIWKSFVLQKSTAYTKKEIPPSWQTNNVLSKLLLFFEVKYSVCIQLSQHAKDDNEEIEEEEEEENDDDDGSLLLFLAFPSLLPSPSSSAATAASSLLL